MARRDAQLYRDTQDQKIAGVCSGLARYFDVDTVLVRILFVVALIFGGGSLLAYVLLWLLVDPAPEGYWDERVTSTAGTAEYPPPSADDQAA
jgi:phage shock protein C